MDCDLNYQSDKQINDISNLKTKVLTPLSSLEEKIGTSQDHMDNYNQIMSKMRSYRDNNHSINRNYKRNIEEARKLVNGKHLVHIAGTEHHSEATKGLKPAKLVEHEDTNDMPMDLELGLDNFIFASFNNPMAGYQGTPIYLNPDLLQREGTVFSVEDIAITIRREAIKTNTNKGEWITHPVYGHKTTTEVLKVEQTAKEKYKRSLMPGNKFKEFMAEFISTYYSHPQMFFGTSSGRPDIEHVMEADAKWTSPEVKIYGEIEPGDIGRKYYKHLPVPERNNSILSSLMKKLALYTMIFQSCISQPKTPKIWKY